MELLISTIVLSSMYALLGAGFIITYKASRILNFAFADIALIMAYTTVALVPLLGGNLTLPIIIILVFGFVFGLMIYRLFIRPMIGQTILATIILTVAVGIILKAIAVLVWKAEVDKIRLPWREMYQLPGQTPVSSTDIITVIAAVVIFSGLACFFKFTTIGRQMRATAENILLSSQRRINIYILTSLAWGIGIFVISLAGVLFGANYGVNLFMGGMALKGLSVAMVGGLDSLGGAIPAAILIALTEKLAVYYINPRLAETIPFIIMLVALIIKPWGILGTKEEIERV